MSLINDVLKDLEARQSKHPRSVEMGNHSIAFKQLPKRQPWLPVTTVLQIVVTLLAAAGIAWWVAKQQAPAPAAAPAGVVAAAPPVVAAPAEEVVAVTKPKPPVAVVAKPKPAVQTAVVPKAAAPVQKAVEVAQAAPAPVPVKPLAVSAPAVKPNAAPAPSKEALAAKAELLYQRALVEQKQGDTEAAVKSLREAIEVHPQSPNARLALAKVLVERKQANAAADLLGDGLMLAPQHTGLMLALAPLWIQAGQQDDAMALLAQGAKSNNKEPQLHAFYAGQLLRVKRWSDAATQYQLALRSDPDKGEWLMGLGLAQNSAGNTREAIEALRRASEMGGLSAQNKTMVDQVVVKLQSQLK